MTKSTKDLAMAMFESLPITIRNQIHGKSLTDLLNHDPADPFGRTVGEYRSGAIITGTISFSGNCVSQGRQQHWIDQNGNKIMPGKYVTRTWTHEYGNDLAEQLKSLGYNAFYNAENCYAKIREKGDLWVQPPVLYGEEPARGYVRTGNDYHYLTLHLIMQGLSGETKIRSFRTDSWGRTDIAEKIASYLQRLEAAMPRDPETSTRKAEGLLRERYIKAFQEEGIKPRISMIKVHEGREGMSFEVEHRMLNGILEEMTQRDYGRFIGTDPGDIWKMSPNSNFAPNDKTAIRIERERREMIERGGLTQTSLTKNLIDYMGYEPQPLHAEYNGSIRTRHITKGMNNEIVAEIQVKKGRLETKVMIAGKVNMTTGLVKVPNYGEIPHAMLQSLRGQPLRNVFEHPLVTSDMMITSASLKGRDLILRIKMKTYLVENKRLSEL